MNPVDTPPTARPSLSMQPRNFAPEDPGPGGWRWLLDLARGADAAGLDRLVFADHVVFGENLEAYGGIHNSQRVLLALTQAGASREDSYRLVQRNGMKTWDEGGMLVDHLKADEGVTALMTDAQIEACFDEAYHMKHVDTIFSRVFGD